MDNSSLRPATRNLPASHEVAQFSRSDERRLRAGGHPNGRRHAPARRALISWGPEPEPEARMATEQGSLLEAVTKPLTAADG